jgi:hypothetical protein
VVRKSKYLKGKYLELLLTLPNQREPYRWAGHQWTAQRFQEMINDCLAHVEAALMQVVGEQNSVECTSCLRREGPFPHCVVVRGITGLAACANCHWAGRDNRWHYRHPVTTIPTRVSQHQPATTGGSLPDTTAAPSRSPPAIHQVLTQLSQALGASRGHRAQLQELVDQVQSVQSPGPADVLLQNSVEEAYASHRTLLAQLRQTYEDVMDILDAPSTS